MDLVKKRSPDFWLLLTTIALAGVGVVMVYSASSIVAHDDFGDGAFFFKRQVLWMLSESKVSWMAYSYNASRDIPLNLAMPE